MVQLGIIQPTSPPRTLPTPACDGWQTILEPRRSLTLRQRSLCIVRERNFKQEVLGSIQSLHTYDLQNLLYRVFYLLLFHCVATYFTGQKSHSVVLDITGLPNLFVNAGLVSRASERICRTYVRAIVRLHSRGRTCVRTIFGTHERFDVSTGQVSEYLHDGHEFLITLSEEYMSEYMPEQMPSFILITRVRQNKCQVCQRNMSFRFPNRLSGWVGVARRAG